MSPFPVIFYFIEYIAFIERCMLISLPGINGVDKCFW